MLAVIIRSLLQQETSFPSLEILLQRFPLQQALLLYLLQQLVVLPAAL